MRRNNWDFAKAVLMFLVILGHVCPALSGDTYKDSWCAMTRITGLFVMPLFFFISGFFQSNIVSAKDLLKKYKKTFLRIGVPLVCWGWVYIICQLNGYIKLYHSVGFLLLLKSGIIEVLKFYWFFSALLLCVFCGSLISLLYNKSHWFGLATITISLLIFTLSKIDLFHFSFVWFFYGCGMIYSIIDRNNNWSFNNTLTFSLVILMSIASVIIGYFFYPNQTFYIKSNLIWETDFRFIVARYLLCFVASVCALYWIFKLFQRCNKNKWVDYMTSSGLDTLFIYCSHVLILSCLVKPIIDISFGTRGILDNVMIVRYYVIAPIISIFLYVILYNLAKFLKKYRIFRVLFMDFQPSNSFFA